MADPTPHPQDLPPDATVALKGGFHSIEDPRATVKIEGADALTLIELEDGSPPRRLGWLPWVLGSGFAAAAAGGAFWFLGRRPAQPAAPVAKPEPAIVAEAVLPPEVAAKVKKADAGDAHAMHALAIWYFYGINIPKDREKGLEWYRKAAAAGSAAARQELAQIEGAR